MKKLYNRISQELVRTHDKQGHAEISLIDGSRVPPGEWVKAVGDKVLTISGKHLNERKDVRQFLWDLEDLRAEGGADVVWSWFDEDANESHLGLGRIVAESVPLDSGFMVEGAPS